MNRSFLSAADRADLVKIARDGLEEHRIARRANAVLLLDKRWSFAEVAEAFYIDDSTVRAWLKAFQDGGVEALVLFDLNGGACALSPLQIDELRAWATEALPTSTTEIGQFILERFGLDYTRSGLIKLMNRIGFDWKKPESVPGKIDVETQQKFIDAHEDLRNSLGPDEAVVYVDAVHPTNQSKPAGRWLPRGQRCALPTASGRDRLNLHGAIDLETGRTSIMDVETVDCGSVRASTGIANTLPLCKFDQLVSLRIPGVRAVSRQAGPGAKSIAMAFAAELHVFDPSGRGRIEPQDDLIVIGPDTDGARPRPAVADDRLIRDFGDSMRFMSFSP